MNPKKDMAKQAGRFLKKASPTILSCLGAFGVVATAVLAVKATPKALERIEMAKEAKSLENCENLTRMETIATCWQCYIPAAATGIATIGCVLGANVLSKHQQASLASAYALVSRQFRDYKGKVKEFYGKEAHERIMGSLAVEKTKNPAIYNNVTGKIFDFGETGEEQKLFYDSFSERYFQATITQVLLAEYHVNRNFALNGGDIPVSEFYKFLGLDTPKDMEGLSWFVSDYYMWVDFAHTKAMVDDGLSGEVECWIIEMDFPPTMEPLEY